MFSLAFLIHHALSLTSRWKSCSPILHSCEVFSSGVLATKVGQCSNWNRLAGMHYRKGNAISDFFKNLL